MKVLKKAFKYFGIYALVTGYCYHVTEQLVIITQENLNETSIGELGWEWPWICICQNLKTIYQNIKNF